MKWSELTNEDRIKIQNAESESYARYMKYGLEAWWEAHPELHAKYGMAKVPESICVVERRDGTDPELVDSAYVFRHVAWVSRREDAYEIVKRYDAHERLLDELARHAHGYARRLDGCSTCDLLREFGR